MVTKLKTADDKKVRAEDRNVSKHVGKKARAFLRKQKTMQIMGMGDDSEHKYLKIKQKYLQLKNFFN